MQNMATILFAVVVLAWIIVRQLQARPVNERNPFTVMVALAGVGLYQIAALAGKVQIPPFAYLTLVVGLGSGAYFGWLRGRLVRVWRRDGQLLRQGNWLTVVLWVAGLAGHLGIDQTGVLLSRGTGRDAASALGTSGILLYVAVALAAQRFATLRRGSLTLQPA
jgi:hypothetical protein